MRSYINADVYTELLNKNNIVSTKLTQLLSNKVTGTVFLNDKLPIQIKRLESDNKTPIMLNVVNAIKSNKIILFSIPQEQMTIPDSLPFVKFIDHKQNEEIKVAVNLSKYVSVRTDRVSGITEYDIDVRKLYILTLSAYIDMVYLSEASTLPADTLYYGALIWARMFNAVLVQACGLGINKDRYEAFMYFAMKFFMIYYAEAEEIAADKTVERYFKNKTKTPYIEMISLKIKDKRINPYTSLSDFCNTMFNNDITGIGGGSMQMNYSFYLRKFMSRYYSSALLALGSFSYFLFVLLSVREKVNICNDKALADILKEDNVFDKMMVGIYRDISLIK